MRQKILLVEDDKHISKLIKYNLEKNGFECDAVITGEEGFALLGSRAFDMVILDIMLPKMDGFEVCKRIKQDHRYTAIPIVILTARGEEVDRIVGLELGADDYIVKPFSPRELILRIKGILKRNHSKTAPNREILNIDQLSVDIPRHRVAVAGKEVQLTSMEFKLLTTLMQRRGRVQSRDQLLNDVWDMDSDVTTRTIDTHIKRLRQKLGKSGKYIETVRGYGYRFYDEE